MVNFEFTQKNVDDLVAKIDGLGLTDVERALLAGLIELAISTLRQVPEGLLKPHDDPGWLVTQPEPQSVNNQLTEAFTPRPPGNEPTSSRFGRRVIWPPPDKSIGGAPPPPASPT